MTEFEELYRAPQPSPRRKEFRVRGSSLKWLYLAVALTGTACLLAAGAAGSQAVALSFRVAGIAAVIGALLVGVAWLHRSWSDIPPEDRSETALGRLSADSAVGRLFVPGLNLFWGFSVHAQLTDAISASLHKRGIGLSAEPQLAYAAMAATLVSRLASTMKEPSVAVMVLTVADILWFAYMSRCDTFRRMMLLAWRAEREAGAPRKSTAP